MTKRNPGKMTIETFTPDQARRILEETTGLFGFKNRSLRMEHVRRLAADMTAGLWVLNGSPVRFDVEGALIDGQHRMAACVMAGVAFTTYVVRGLDRSVFTTIDSGVARINADHLQSEFGGMKYANTVAAAAAFALRLEAHGGDEVPAYSAGRAPRAASVIEWVKANPDVVEAAAWWSRRERLRRMCRRSGVVTYLFMMFRRWDPGAAETFMDRLDDGVGLEAGSPILAVRNRLQNMMGSNTKLDDRACYSYLMSAWTAFVEGRSLSKVLLRKRK